MKLVLLPISYWYEFLDMIFFFKVVTGIDLLNSNRNVTHFISRKCNTVTFQRSFKNRTTRIWNTLANDRLTFMQPSDQSVQIYHV